LSNTNHEKIKLTKSRHNNIRLPKINWGGGRLNKHESFVAFAAKFCRLNSLTPKQFREFWKTSINIFDNDQQEREFALSLVFLMNQNQLSELYLKIDL